MGLDCFASRIIDDIELTEEDEQAFTDANLYLCGGFNSGGGSSFRGKVYVDLVFAATQMSISESLESEEVRTLSERLDRYTPEQLSELSTTPEVVSGPHSSGTCLDLQRFFRICVKRGLCLVAWS